MEADDRTRVAVYAFRNISPVERNCTANDREILGFINGLQKFRRYLDGWTFSVLAGNQEVSRFFSKRSLSRWKVWWLWISIDLNISLPWLTLGRDNVSGNALFYIRIIDTNNVTISTRLEQTNWDSVFGHMEENQVFGAVLGSVKDHLPECSRERKWVKLLQYSFQRDGQFLCYKNHLCVPWQSVLDMLEETNNVRSLGHFTVAKTVWRLDGFHWKQKLKDMKAHFEGFLICHQEKENMGWQFPDPMDLEFLVHRWGMTATDVIVGLTCKRSGHDAVATFVDRFSTWVHRFPSH